MNLVKQIATNNRCYQAGRKIMVKGIMLHSVGCPQPSGKVFANRMNDAGNQVCVHAFIDANDGKVYQILPWNHRAWHCGGEANNTHIGVEMCEPSCIQYKGGASFSCSDKQKALTQVKTVITSAVELFAYLCKEYNLNPLEEGVIISHKEGHDKGVASGHADPDHLFKQLNMNYSMNDFRKEVAAKMGKVADPVRTNMKKEPKKEECITKGNMVVGDVVAIKADAVYYTGKEIPDWVKKEKWIIKSVSGDKVVIDANVSGTHYIASPVHRKYLKKQ